MVLVEEIDEDTPVAPPEPPKKAPSALKPGFLDGAAAKAAPLYPDGSPEGVVAAETHKAHNDHKVNENLNESMNRGAKDNNGIDRPPWYTKEWPKDCQYNSPGCYLDEMDSSTHASVHHKEMTRGTRWQEALAPGNKRISLSYVGIVDEDLAELLEHLRGNDAIEELDLSHNKLNDTGMQALVAALSTGAAPNLKELKVYSNEFGELGKTMLTQGLPVFRKKLQIKWEEPAWAREAREGVAAARAGYAAAAVNAVAADTGMD